MAPVVKKLYLPEGHAVHNEDADAALAVLYRPAAQATHAEEADAEASTL